MDDNQFANLKAKLYADAAMAKLTDDEASAVVSVPTYVPRSGLVTIVSLGSLLTADTAAELRMALLAASQSDDLKTAARAGYTLDSLRVGVNSSDPEAQAFAAILVGLKIGITPELARDALNVATYPQGGPATADEVHRARASTAAELLTGQLDQQVAEINATARRRLEAYRTAVDAGETPKPLSLADLLAA